MLQLMHGNVLDAYVQAEALILTIDGQARGLRGNIAHEFIRRWPEDYEDFESQLHFPVPLGSAIRVDADTDAPWHTVLFVAILHHVETLDGDTKLDVAGRALASALALAARTRLRSIATAPLKGGWRLALPEAYSRMMVTFDGSDYARRGGRLTVFCRDADEYETLVALHRIRRGGGPY